MEHGITDIHFIYEASESDGSHSLESVWATGSLDILISAARKLADAGCMALVWPCKCASFIGGLKWAIDQAEALTKKATGLVATSTSLALLAALRQLSADTVDVLSPYPAQLTQHCSIF